MMRWYSLKSLLPPLAAAFAVAASGNGAAWPEQAGPAMPPLLQRFLDSAAPSELAAIRAPGAAITVVIGDSIVYARGFGVASVETGAPVTPDMLFRLASTTKMLTATAVLLAASKGQLDLDRPLDSLFPAEVVAVNRLTLRDLLRHRAGLREGSSYYGPHDDGALRSFVRSWADSMLFTSAGDVYSYSNLGYAAAAAALEQATGRFYADVMAEMLFGPLGMRRSTLRPTEAMTHPIVQGHDPGSDGMPLVVRPYSDDVRYWPGGGVFTSANEFARFVIAVLNRGRIRGVQVLPEAVVGNLLTRQTDVPGSPPDERAGYTFGLVERELRGVRVYQHGGVRVGFGSVVRIIPERRAAIIILANRTNGLLLRTLEGATDLLAGRPQAASVPASPAAELSNAEMTAAAGRYLNTPGEWELELVLRADRLWLRRPGAAGESPVTRLADGRYSAAGQPFVLLNGAATSARYLHIAGHALRKQ